MLLAPADEYFGPLKLSIIGMRNTIRDLGLRYDVNHDIAKQTFASAQLVERSIREWQTKYVRDPQLPRVIFVLQRLYTKVLTQESRDRARETARWLATDFGPSPQARQLSKTLALEHLAPLPPPTPEPSATPEPEATYASIFGRPYPSEFAPEATPSPRPSPTRAPIRPAARSTAAPTPSPYPFSQPSAVPAAAPARASSPKPAPASPKPTLPSPTPERTPRPATPAPSPKPTASPTPAPTPLATLTPTPIETAHSPSTPTPLPR
ncbi:MAG: hypothetical protein NVSMB21_15010 [Vulcanimicrobiaceae bacterium]